MKPDLHSHSYFSDGKHSPQFVVDRARSNDVTHLALTDHDCIEGLLRLPQQDMPDGIEMISGVEISAAWEHLEVHVLGLCFDPADPVLSELLNRQQLNRRIRMTAIENNLEKAGIMGLGEHLNTLPCVSFTRAHVADFLVTKGHKRSHRQAFKSLARQGRFYARPDWCSLETAITTIQAAGGLSVLAHPHRYSLSNSGLKKLVSTFAQLGGDGLEVACSNITSDNQGRLVKLGQEFSLMASAGSDFHTTDASWIDLGRLPGLCDWAIKNAIWTHSRWHCLSL